MVFGLEASKTVAATTSTLACIIKGKVDAGLISLPSGVTLNDIPTIDGTISSGRTVREFFERQRNYLSRGFKPFILRKYASATKRSSFDSAHIEHYRKQSNANFAFYAIVRPQHD